MSDVRTQQSIASYVRVRFDLPARIDLPVLNQVVHDVATVGEWADDAFRYGALSLVRPPVGFQPVRDVRTRVVRVRYGSELSLLLEALPTLGGTAFVAWLLTFARDLPGRLRQSVEAGRQAALETRRIETAVNLQEAAARRYIGTKQLELEIAQLLVANLADAVARDEHVSQSGDLDDLEEDLTDELIAALFRLSSMISAVEQVDESEIAE